MEGKQGAFVYKSTEQLTQEERNALVQNLFMGPRQQQPTEETSPPTKKSCVICKVLGKNINCILHNPNRGRTLVGNSLRALDLNVNLTDDQLQESPNAEPFVMTWTPLYEARLHKILDETNQNYLANERAAYINRIDDVPPFTPQCRQLQKEYQDLGITYSELISKKAQGIEDARRSGSKTYIREQEDACKLLVDKVTSSVANTIPYLMTACPGTPNLDLTDKESQILQNVSIENAIATDYFIENMEQEVIETKTCVESIEKRLEEQMWREVKGIKNVMKDVSYTNLFKLQFVEKILSKVTPRQFLQSTSGNFELNSFDSRCAFIISQHHVLGIEMDSFSKYPIYQIDDNMTISQILTTHYNPIGMHYVNRKLEILMMLHSEIIDWFCGLTKYKIHVKAKWTPLAVNNHIAVDSTLETFTSLAAQLNADAKALHCLQSTVKDFILESGEASSISSLDDEVALALYLLEEKKLVQLTFTIPTIQDIKTRFHDQVQLVYSKEHDRIGLWEMLEMVEEKMFEQGIAAVGHVEFYRKYRMAEISHVIRNSNQVHQLLMAREIEKELDEIRTIASPGLLNLIIILIAHTEHNYMLKMYSYKGKEIFLDEVVGHFEFDRKRFHRQVHKIKLYCSDTKIPYYVILPVSTSAIDYQGVIMYDAIVPKYQVYVMPTVMVKPYSSLFNDEETRLAKSIEFGCHAIRHPAAAVCTFLIQKVDKKVAVDNYCYHVLDKLVGRKKYISRTSRATKIVITYTKPEFSDMVTDPYMRDVIPFWIERRPEFYYLINKMLSVLSEYGNEWPTLISKRKDIYFLFMLTKEEIEARGHILYKGDACRSQNAAIKSYKFTEDAMVNDGFFKNLKELAKVGKTKVTDERLNELMQTDLSNWPKALKDRELYLKLNIRKHKNNDVRNTAHCIRNHLTKVRGSYYDLTMSCGLKMLGRHVVSKKVATFLHQFFPEAARSLNVPEPNLLEDATELTAQHVNNYQWGKFIILTHSFSKDYLKITRSLAFQPYSMKKQTTILLDHGGIEEECRLNAALNIRDSQIRYGEDWFLRINYPSVPHHQLTVTDATIINTFQKKEKKFIKALTSSNKITELIERHGNDLFQNMSTNQFTFERVTNGYLMVSTFFQMNMLPGHVEQWDPKLSKNQKKKKQN